MEDCFGRQTGNLMLSTYSQEDPLGWPNFRCLILSTRVPEKTALDWGGGGDGRGTMGWVQNHRHGAKEDRNKETQEKVKIERNKDKRQR